MAEELTREEMIAKAERLYLDAAIAWTKLEKRMRRAVLLVMVENKTPADAARAVGRPRQHVSRALKRVRDRLAAVKDATNGN